MSSALLPVFNRIDLSFERGEGCWLFASDGRRYLDFGSGIAVSSLGHGHEALVAAITEQARRVIHVSNLYRIPQAEILAEKLVANSFADQVFFCNSGAEANEGLIKMVRRFHAENGHPERQRLICFHGAFHGRTLATLAATGNENYLKGFGPPADGFDHVAFNNMNEVRAAITPQTAGILVEPIQGESGVKPLSTGFLKALRQTCDEYGLLLALDEVQTGIGRTGKLFAYEWEGISPDVISLAKGLGGGVPIGAILVKSHVGQAMTPGTHGSTFGGNPLACAAGNVVLDIVTHPGFLERVERTGRILSEKLGALCQHYGAVFTLARGRGLIWGLKCVPPVAEVMKVARGYGLLCTAAGDNTLRLIPPLIVSEAECAIALDALEKTAQHFTLSSTES
ncbi:aspartate aminotransferase family protein [Candidatus Kirkpatrickella diaphorinae]|uniref:Acetylornithine aminotransferase n=1 Tax=Candidatus Kirkpatrickella diaphorinae TaxID=2984322 RepID=A0ABY6GK69_9PROT|nr:aspartate aminotransferase family protein [Candidatus Kirkpatrickella diaphorinae]UYH51133.1 aspartate aminotransferase family protein [Candidatus Kirkpatrickella diaphorinae]